MKNLVYFLAILFIVTSCNNKSETEGKNADLKSQDSEKVASLNKENDNKEEATAAFEFEEKEWDFGKINEGEVVTHVFEFKNVGESPLIIQSARASCGCTVPEWTREPIPVNGTGMVEVSFNSTGRPNVQNKTVTIVANTQPEITTLRIRAMVMAESDQAMGPVRKN